MNRSRKSVTLLLMVALGGCTTTVPVTYVEPSSGTATTLAGSRPGLIQFQFKRECDVIIAHVDRRSTANVTEPIHVAPGEHTVRFEMRCKGYRVAEVSRSLTFLEGRSYQLTSTFDDEEVQFIYRFLDITTSPSIIVGEYTAYSRTEAPAPVLLLPLPIKIR